MVGKNGAIAILGLAIGGFLAYKLLGGDDPEPDKVTNLPGPLDGSKPTLSGAEINSKVATVFSAMADIDPFNWGFDKVKNQLKGLNGADLLRVYKAFGYRRYIFWGYDETGLGEKLDLFGWFRKEFKTGQITELQRIWASTGMKI